jgi:hypothetical protein
MSVGGSAVNALPSWMHLSLIAVVVLLSPVFAFLIAIAVEIVIGEVAQAGVPAIIAIVVALIVGWSLARKLRRPQGGAPIET